MDNALQYRVQRLEDEIRQLKAELDRRMQTHEHNGVESSRINTDDLIGGIEVLSAAPVGDPQDLYGQLKIYSNALYVYDSVNEAWFSTSGSGGALNPQVPSGTIDGSNDTFTITGTIQMVTQNGKVLDPSTEWSVSGTTLTLTVAPDPGDSLYAY